uniref:Uncharacterized protein n=1 Tax=Romanomermis culicivorax TaxID=13658 RepID=A0A915KY02_ROMCU
MQHIPAKENGFDQENNLVNLKPSYIGLKDEHIQRVEKINHGQVVQEPAIIEFASHLPIDETEDQKRGVENEAYAADRDQNANDDDIR